MTDYVIVGLEYQRQFAWEPVCHPGMDDCVDTWTEYYVAYLSQFTPDEIKQGYTYF